MTLGSSANEDTANQVRDDVVKTDVTETQVNQDAPATGNTEQSSSSESSDAKKPESPLDAAKAALGLPAAASSTGMGTDQQKPPEAKDDDKSAEAKGDQADKEPPPFHNHPRWKEVTKRNRELETVNGELTDKAQRGVHLSLGAKHTVYSKPGVSKKQSRYHVDIFLDVTRVLADGKSIYQDGDFCVT
jgi:hypothetical protein